MRRVRARLLALVGCLLLAAAPAGSAAPRCPLLTDPVGDQEPASDPAADLVRVDVASDRRSATVVVGYAGEQPAALPVQGHSYVVRLDSLEGAVLAWADVSGADTGFVLYRTGSGGGSATAGTSLGEIRGRVDPVRHTVHMVVPFRLAPDLLVPGAVLTVDAQVSTSVVSPDLPVTGHAFVTSQSDSSDRPARVVLGRPGCVALEK